MSLYLGIGVAFAAACTWLCEKGVRESGGAVGVAVVLVVLTLLWPVLILAWVRHVLEGDAR